MKHTMPPWLLLVGGLMACERPAPRTPEAGYRAFAEALRRSDARGAWATLSRPTRTLLEGKAHAISEASGGVIKEDAPLMVFQSGTRPGAVSEVRLVQSDGETAVVEVAGAPRPGRVKLVRDGQSWLVDLVDVFGEKQLQ
jgi:hypothetical protein